jgi:hypothetical protein
MENNSERLRFLTLQETAEVLHLSTRTLLRMLQRKDLPPSRWVVSGEFTNRHSLSGSKGSTSFELMRDKFYALLFTATALFFIFSLYWVYDLLAPFRSSRMLTKTNGAHFNRSSFVLVVGAVKSSFCWLEQPKKPAPSPRADLHYRQYAVAKFMIAKGTSGTRSFKT